MLSQRGRPLHCAVLGSRQIAPRCGRPGLGRQAPARRWRLSCRALLGCIKAILRLTITAGEAHLSPVSLAWWAWLAHLVCLPDEGEGGKLVSDASLEQRAGQPLQMTISRLWPALQAVRSNLRPQGPSLCGKPIYVGTSKVCLRSERRPPGRLSSSCCCEEDMSQTLAGPKLDDTAICRRPGG